MRRRRALLVLPCAAAVALAGTSEPHGACAEDGCLRWLVHLGDFTRADIERVLPAGIEIENGYSVYDIGFATSGRDANAVVAIPFGRTPPKDGWHLVANNPGTVGLADRCALVGTLAGAGQAGTFAARGFVCVAIDYPGLGTQGLEPYMVSKVEGPAVLDALRAARQLAAYAGAPLSGRCAIVGTSQGGHASLAAAARHKRYAPDVDLRAVAVAAPASIAEEDWSLGARFDGAHLVYHAILIRAWEAHYGWKGLSLWASPSVPEALDRTCAWSPRGEPILETELSPVGSEIFSARFLDAYKTGNWGAFASFHGWFLANRIGPYEQTAPLKVYQGDDDAAVPEETTRRLVKALEAGGVKVDYERVPKGTHLDVAFGFLAVPQLRMRESIAWIRAQLDGPPAPAR